MKRLAAAVLVVGIGCESGASSGLDAGSHGGDAASSSRRFEHALYPNPEDCPDDPLFNCYPSVELCADNSAFMLVTDIVNQGTYAELSAAILVSFDVGDVPNAISFAVSGDGQILTDDWQGWEWHAAANEYPFCD